jgi:FAD synthase
VTFNKKLRDEQTFASIDELKAQIEADIESAKAWFASS